MAAKSKTESFVLFTDRVYGSDKGPDGKKLRPDITRDADWRDPDVIFRFDGNMVVEPIDRSVGLPGEAIEPDWKQGVVIQDRGTGQPVMTFAGEPPDFFKQAWKSGQPLVGVIAIRDMASHN